LAQKSILLIEPSENERKELGELLQRLGYQVDSAIGSEDGLRLFGESRHDLVIVQLVLSGMNGLKVCKLVKEQSAEWGGKVIVISKIYQSRAMESDALNRYGADAYFAQPFPLANLFNAVSAMIGEPEPGARSVAPPASAEPPPTPRKRPVSPRPQAEAPKPAAPRPSEVRIVQPPPLADEGEFDPETLGVLLARLARDQISGLLALSTGEEVKQVFLIEGRPVFVQSTNQEETLGRLLLADGILTESQYREATVRMAESGKKLGTVLTSLGYLTGEELVFHLSGQTLRKMARCFAWPRGKYKLHRDKTYPSDAPTFDADPAAVVLEGYRRHVDAAVLETAFERDKDKFLFLGGAAEVAVMRAQLDEKTARLLSAVDGKYTLGEICGESDLSPIETLRLLGAMIALGAISLAATTHRPEPSAPEAPQPPQEAEPRDLNPREQALTSEIRKFAVQLDDLDFFQVLGLDRKPDDATVNRAYLALQRRFDPARLSPAVPRQVQRMAAAILERLQTAYDALHDQVGRRKYLRQLTGEKPGEPPLPAEEITPGNKSKSKEIRGLVQQALLSMEHRHHAVAVDTFRKALALDPQNGGLQIKLAQAMFGALAEPPFTWAEVEEAAKQALASNKNDPEALALLGRIKVRQNDDESALRFLKKAFEQNPRNETVRREIHYAEQRLKEADKKTSFFGKKR